MAYVRNYTALTTGVWRWNKAETVGTPTVVTYSFLERGELPGFDESSPANAAVGNRYVTMTAAQRSSIRDALGQFELKSGLRFVEVNDPADASIKFHANQSLDLTSWAYLPPTPSVNGDIRTGDVFVTITSDPGQSWTLSSARGSSIYTVMLHEIGHAIGLEHPHERVLLAPDMDNHDFTIMSYDWSWSGDSSGRARDSLATLDVQAIRHLYGEAAGFTAVWRPAGQFIEIDGGAGHDRIVTGRAPSLMSGGVGNDRLTGAQFNDTLKGGSGNDQLNGGAGNDILAGHRGGDVLLGGGGNDVMMGVEDNDRMAGGNGNDRMHGGAGNDRLYGGNGSDRVVGFDGADLLQGGPHQDSLDGGLGADTLIGELGDDSLIGGPQNDRMGGGGGNDILIGATGQDSLWGHSGIDQLIGGDGYDTLNGGPGADLFAFRGVIGRDLIEDWENGADRILLRGYAGIDDLADVLAVSRQRGADVYITVDRASIIVLKDTTLSELDGPDFIF